MHTIQSNDGTPIGYTSTGTGPPLLLVHGTAGDSTRWLPLLPQLEPHFTVCAMDRRGRGHSGDGAQEYAIQHEFEDVAAVIESISDSTGESINVLGHSYGALCCLEAALLTRKIGRLILYEPPPTGDPSLFPAAAVAEIQRFLDAGDPDEAIVTFMREVVGIDDAEIDALKALPSWAGRLTAAHTLPREERATMELPRFDPARFSAMQTPTLLLLGGESPAFFADMTHQIDHALLDSRIVVMPGQQHVAMNTAPDLFLQAVFEFLGVPQDR